MHEKHMGAIQTFQTKASTQLSEIVLFLEPTELLNSFN